MKDTEKTKAQLIEELATLRQRIAELSSSASHREQTQATLLSLSSVVQASIDSIVLTDLTGKILDVNEATLRMHGTNDKSDLIGKNTVELIAPAERQRAVAYFQEVLAQGYIKGREYHVVLKSGATIPVELSAAVLKDADGTPLGLVGITRDITERKRLEEALRQAKEVAEAASRLKSDFLAVMSHELRTPLNVVVGYTDLLLEGDVGPLTDAQAAFLRRVRKAAYEEVELITVLLDVSRLEAGQMPVEITRVNVPELIAGLRQEVESREQHPGPHFEWQVAPGLPLLWTDRLKLKVVLTNLLGNAAKFTGQGSVTVTVSPQKGGVEFGVTDTGVGITPEVQEVMFEMFRQGDTSRARRSDGVGLGLYIVRRLLELLGGTISVESEPRKGSTFRVWIPHRAAEGQAA